MDERYKRKRQKKGRSIKGRNKDKGKTRKCDESTRDSKKIWRNRREKEKREGMAYKRKKEREKRTELVMKRRGIFENIEST